MLRLQIFGQQLQHLIIMYKLDSPKIKKQKLSQNDKLVPNLSQLYIQIPKPQFSTKTQYLNYNNQTQHLQYHNNFYCQNDINTLSANKLDKTDSNDLMIFSNSKTKSSSRGYSQRSQSQIIKEYIQNIFYKRSLLTDWEQKFSRKNKSLKKLAFLCIKQAEENKTQSVYLQTQSKYNSFRSRCQPLVSIALESFRKINQTVQKKIKRNAFSMILRFLIFESSNIIGKDKHYLHSSRIFYQSIITEKDSQVFDYFQKNQKNRCFKICSNNVNVHCLVRAQNIKNKIDIHKIRDFSHQTIFNNLQNKNQILLTQNQYALNPLSPSTKSKTQKVNFENNKFLKAKKNPEEKQIKKINLKQSPNMHITNELNSPKNIIETNKRPVSHSPLTHFVYQPITKDIFHHENLHNFHHSNYPRNDQLKKSRSISFSGKIRFQDPKNHQNIIQVHENQVNKLSTDYQDPTNYMKLSKDKFLGIQNKKNRQNYHKNSYNHELVQDGMMNFHENHIKYHPISPLHHNNFRTQLIQPVHFIKAQQIIRKSSPRGSHNIFGKHSFMPVNAKVQNVQLPNNPNMRRSMDVFNGGQTLLKKISKDKLAVTQKIKYN